MVTRLFYILFLVIFSASIAFSQEKIFEDDFKDNRNGWMLKHDSNFLVDIRNGCLHIEKFQKNFVSRGCLWYSKAIPGLNTGKDFSITFYAKYLTGGDIFDLMDVQWGNRLQPKNPSKPLPENSLYQLNFIMTGEVKLDYFDNNWTYFVRKNIKALLGEQFDAKKINKYEIAQTDSLVIFRVNDKEVLKQFCNPVSGNSIGFQQCLKTAWEIDRIEIRQSENKKPISPDTASRRSIVSSEVNYPSDNALKVYPNPFDHDLYVNIYLEKEDNVQLYLVDMNGIIVQQHNKHLPAGIQHIRLYADVPPGSYLLKMQIGKRILTSTVIRQ